MDEEAAFGISEISVEKWEQWREVRLAALFDSPSAFESTYEQWVSAPESQWRGRLSSVGLNLIAEEVGSEPKSLGMASGVLDAGGSTAELVAMWVEPSARGRGVADALIERVAMWARGLTSELWLAITPGNDRAMAVYRRHGFVLSDKLGEPSAGGFGRDLVMVRLLP